MKIASIHYDPFVQHLVRRAVARVFPVAAVWEYHSFDFKTAKEREKLVWQRYDFMVLPLTISAYGSLLIPALLRTLQAPPRTILVSGTTAPRQTLETLYDASIATWSPAMEYLLERAFREAPSVSRVTSLTMSEL